MKNMLRQLFQVRAQPAAIFSACGANRLEVDKWMASDTALRLQRIVGKRPYPLDELMLMTAVFCYIQPAVVIDIGTHVGKSARVWWELSRLFGFRCDIHTIDLYDRSHAEYPGEMLGKMIKGLSVMQHRGDGLTIANDLLRKCAGTPCLLFLDGDHAFETVSKELGLAVQHSNVAGVLVHDTFYQPGSKYNHGPFEAVSAFVATTEVREVVHAHMGLPGMTFIRV